MKINLIKLSTLCLLSSMFFVSCKKDILQRPAQRALSATILKEWHIQLSSKYQVPAVSCSKEQMGTVCLQLFSDNSLKYKIEVKDVPSDDKLVAAHIHEGNPLENGSIVLGLEPTFIGGNANGIITNLRSTFVDSLQSDANELYFNVHSTKHPKGVVRGQLNAVIDLADDVILSGANQIPSINTTAKGLALIRLTADKKLYSNVTVKDLEMGDNLIAAHIHSGAAGANGPVSVVLCKSAADFGMIQINTLTDAVYMSVKSGYNYVNAHSTNHPKGIVRGQINN